jgi:hypothetical protein
VLDPEADFDATVPEGFEDIEAAADDAIEEESSPIYGGEGFGTVRRRHLLVLVPLPVYYKDKEHPERGIDLMLQGQMLESDIREAMAQAARKLHDTAMKYTVTGYDWDLDEIQYDMPVARTLSATLVIERE